MRRNPVHLEAKAPFGTRAAGIAGLSVFAKTITIKTITCV